MFLFTAHSTYVSNDLGQPCIINAGVESMSEMLDALLEWLLQEDSHVYTICSGDENNSHYMAGGPVQGNTKMQMQSQNMSSAP